MLGMDFEDFEDVLAAVKALNGQQVEVTLTCEASTGPFKRQFRRNANHLKRVLDERSPVPPGEAEAAARANLAVERLIHALDGGTITMRGVQEVELEEPGYIELVLRADDGSPRGEYDVNDTDYQSAHWTTDWTAETADTRTLVIQTEHTGRIEITPQPR